MNGHRTTSRWASAVVLAFGVGLPLAGCGEPAYPGDPAGVNRTATPQVIVKKDDIYIDGHLVRQHKTTNLELKAWAGFDPDAQEESDAFWDKTGITIHATQYNERKEKPILVHAVRVWLRRDRLAGLKTIDRECTEAEVRQHNESVSRRLREITEDDLQRGTSSEELKGRIRAEKCVMTAERPLHAFSGYLEVDGLPLTANMSLHEIQARRKQLGLPPLYNRVIGGPLMYNAPHKANDTAFYQMWEFEYVPQPGKSVDEQKMLKMVDL